MNARWNALSARDRRVLVAGAAACIVLLGWALLWHPLDVRRAELQRTVETQRQDLAFLRQGAAQIARQREAGTLSRAQRQGRSLLALADASARGAGLESSLRRVEPVGARSVRVSFEGASFDALATWMEALARDYGIEASDLSADHADGIGLVNARVTLEDAP
jgi:general secretion pathway protein M